MSEPVPDVSLLKPRSDFYSERHPLPEDVLLVIEISYTTFRFDSKIKAPLYAGPRKYTHHEIFKYGQTISPQSFPEITFSIEEILG